MECKSKRMRSIASCKNSERHQIQEDDDILSSLPDALLVVILSILPIKSAVSTTVLSKRWRGLWTQITSLTIDYRDFQGTSDFYPIIDHFLTQLISPFICSFILRLDRTVDFPSTLVESWFQRICDRNIETFEVDFGYVARRPIIPVPPPFIFQTQSLVVLNLVKVYDFKSLDFDDNVVINLPNLKKTRLPLHPSQCSFISKLTRACPLLEEMFLFGTRNWSEHDGLVIDISSRTLKRLCLRFMYARENTNCVIDAPKVCHLDLYARSRMKFLFVTKPNAVTSARIMNNPSKTLMLSLLPLISDVNKLSLSCSALCALMDLKEDKSEGCSMFGRLSWSSVNSLLTNVKRIKIKVSQLRSEPQLLKLVKDLLRSAGSLEVFSLYVTTTPSEIESNTSEERLELMFCEALYRIPISSTECKIEFFGRFHRESGRGSVAQICSSDQFISVEQKVQVQSAAPTVSSSSSC